MTPDIQELIAELEEALKAATAGPWMADDNYVLTDTRELARCYASPDTRGTLPSTNARLIALMRTHLPTLLEAVKRQGEALEWQPIETAPKDTLIDIWIDNGNGSGVRWASCHYDQICDQWRQITPGHSVKWVPAKAVTHFCLPPNPPTHFRELKGPGQ